MEREKKGDVDGKVLTSWSMIILIRFLLEFSVFMNREWDFYE